VVTKAAGKEYVYYRSAKYNREGHPRDRVREAGLDEQVVAMLGRLRQSDAVRDWFGRMPLLWAKENQDQNRVRTEDIRRQRTSPDEPARPTAKPSADERDGGARRSPRRTWSFGTGLPPLPCGVKRLTGAATNKPIERPKCLNFRKGLTDRRVKADNSAKRQILDLVCLNFRLVGVTLVPEWRKPFDLLTEGLSVLSSRGDRRLAFPNESGGRSLFMRAVTQSLVFSADELLIVGR
jgi:hypothetical protein